VEAGKQTGGAGMRCVGSRIGGGGEGGGVWRRRSGCETAGGAAGDGLLFPSV